MGTSSVLLATIWVVLMLNGVSAQVECKRICVLVCILECATIVGSRSFHNTCPITNLGRNEAIEDFVIGRVSSYETDIVSLLAVGTA